VHIFSLSELLFNCSKKQASNKAKKFTKKRQAWVSDFKRSLRSSPLADDDKTGSEFLEKLLNFLKTKIPDLTIADLHSWIDHHPWITEQIVRISRTLSLLSKAVVRKTVMIKNPFHYFPSSSSSEVNPP